MRQRSMRATTEPLGWSGAGEELRLQPSSAPTRAAPAAPPARQLDVREAGATLAATNVRGSSGPRGLTPAPEQSPGRPHRILPRRQRRAAAPPVAVAKHHVHLALAKQTRIRGLTFELSTGG